MSFELRGKGSKVNGLGEGREMPMNNSVLNLELSGILASKTSQLIIPIVLRTAVNKANSKRCSAVLIS